MTSIYQWADKVLPTRPKRVLSDLRIQTARHTVCISHRSPHNNLFHCCVPKTASRWVKLLLSDRMTYKYSGLKHVDMRQRGFEPVGEAIIGPLYIDYETFRSLPRNEPHRVVFIMRDPRDVVVSWYFSMLYSHELTAGPARFRSDLQQLEKPEGLVYAIEQLHEEGRFDALRSWKKAEGDEVTVLRYEEATGANSFVHIRALFDQWGIAMPDEDLRSLLRKYSFKRMSDRDPGQENVHAKYRKGVPGDWVNHFDARVTSKFRETAGDLVTSLGYERSESW